MTPVGKRSITHRTENTTTVSIDFSAYGAKAAAFNERADGLLPENKRGLFAALAHAGVITVVVTFDGCGDSGQVESVTALSSDDEVPVPAELIEIQTTSFGRYGLPTTCSSRFRRWAKVGVWDRIFKAVSKGSNGDLQMIDACSIRVHQYGGNVKNGGLAPLQPRLGTTLEPSAWGVRGAG